MALLGKKFRFLWLKVTNKLKYFFQKRLSWQNQRVAQVQPKLMCESHYVYRFQNLKPFSCSLHRTKSEFRWLKLKINEMNGIKVFQI